LALESTGAPGLSLGRMTGDHHGQAAGRATVLVRAVGGIPGTQGPPPHAARISATTMIDNAMAAGISHCRTSSPVIFRTAWNGFGTVEMTGRKRAARS
jgi:hypothetical protein